MNIVLFEKPGAAHGLQPQLVEYRDVIAHEVQKNQ